MMKQIAIGVVLLILGLTAVNNDPLALMHQKSLNELTDEADYIVVGTVKDMKSEYGMDNANIYTDVTIGIERVIKGKGEKIENEIVVKIKGGEVDDLGQWVEDEPEFISNEKVLLFLDREGKGKGKERHFIIKGKFQGKYTIEGDEAINKGLGVSIRTKEFIDAIISRDKNQTYDVESLERNAISGQRESGCCTSITHLKWHKKPVKYHKNSSFPSGWHAAIDKAAQASWNNVANFTFENAGSIPKDCFKYDEINIICNGPIDGPGGTISELKGWYKSISGEILDVDMKFDSEELWHTSILDECPPDKLDLWNVAAHQFGHWLRLQDVFGWPCTEETMYGGPIYPGETKKRGIYCGDRNGIRALYP